MNQTRMLLIFAWLTVATLLWMAWDKEQLASAAPVATVAGEQTAAVPAATTINADGVPSMSPAPTRATAPSTAAAASPRQEAVTVRTDVLEVALDGGEVRRADLLAYPSTAEADSAPVQLFAQDPANYFVAQSGWVNDAGAAPGHRSGFTLDRAALPAGADFKLDPGENEVVVPFTWTGPDGVTIHRTYTFSRGDYAVQVRDEVVNNSGAPWQGFIYRQLSRVPRALESTGPLSVEQYSFQGAAWFGAGEYDKRAYEDFVEDGPLHQQVTGGWIAMLQHHFFGGWIPQADQPALYTLEQANGHYTIEARGPSFSVVPGTSATTTARLWVGPKLVTNIQSQQVPGLERAVDFSSFSPMATLAGWLFWVLEKLHGLLGNWGWAIVGLVVLIKLVMFPLSTAQYKSMAKMRKFQPRMAQLKERYGDDRQKLQMAMMELYKKEKINPVGGCLPVLLQMPVFLALYWVLLESVELRHAPWIGWIHNLTAPDPLFILPVLNIVVMWATQKLTPSPGMDPMQKKMMQIMPPVFGIMFAFFPAGLVLYWVTNGALGLLQQWWMTKRHGGDALPAKA